MHTTAYTWSVRLTHMYTHVLYTRALTFSSACSVYTGAYVEPPRVDLHTDICSLIIVLLPGHCCAHLCVYDARACVRQSVCAFGHLLSTLYSTLSRPSVSSLVVARGFDFLTRVCHYLFTAPGLGERQQKKRPCGCYFFSSYEFTVDLFLSENVQTTFRSSPLPVVATFGLSDFGIEVRRFVCQFDAEAKRIVDDLS